MNQNGKWVVLTRDVDALLIPTAVPISIPSGTQIQISQMIGGSYTVFVSGNLARIEGKDHDALGFENPPEAMPVIRSQNRVAAGPVEESQIWDQLKTCYDPEIPVNIVDLGLVYGVSIVVSDDGKSNQVEIQMTLTAPGCGMGPVIANDVEQKVLSVENVTEVKVSLVFDPPWDRERMSEAAKLELGLL